MDIVWGEITGVDEELIEVVAEKWSVDGKGVTAGLSTKEEGKV